MTRRYTGGFLSATEQVTDANTANGIFSVQEAGALTAAGSFPTGRWTPQRSLRFRNSASAYLTRTPGSTSSTRTAFTFSAWVKRGLPVSVVTYNTLLAASPTASSGDYSSINFANATLDDQLVFNQDGYQKYYTNALFRDYSAWYHVVCVYNSNDTAGNRVKFYVNGVQQSTVVNNEISSGASHKFGVSGGSPMQIGRHGNNAGWTSWMYADMYMSETNYVDGQALTPSAFGMTDAETGTWVPKRYAGTYGTNGFYLDFRDPSAASAAAIGADRSGNGNNWTPNNIAVSGVTSTTLSYTTVGSSTFTPPANVSSVNYLVVAGGGAGGSAGPNMYDGGAAGGGAGGMLTGTLAVTPGTPYTITVGGAGTGAANRTRGASGSNSVFGSLTAIGGGGGGGGANTTSGANGGSGGGGANGGAAGTGTAGQGNDGGFYVGSPGNGGGGRGSIGGSASSNVGAAGGTGASSDISGSSVTYAGGGGGGGYQLGGGSGGSSVGGAGGSNNSNGSNASSYGSGGGGSGGTYNTTGTLTGGNGSQGIVIISYSVPDSTYDSYVDVPGIASTSSQTDFGGVTRGNYATLNPIANGTNLVCNSGNLAVSNSSQEANHRTARANMGMTTGKWYWEVNVNNSANVDIVGIVTDISSPNTYVGATANSFGWGYNTSQAGYYGAGEWTSSGTAPAWGASSIIGIALDLDAGKIWFSSNGTWITTATGVGNPSLGTHPTAIYGGTPGTTFFPAVSIYYNTGTWTFNFGQRPFKYATPTGFKTLNTTNLPNPVIKRPSEQFDVKLWTGNGTGLTVGTTVKQSSAYAINKSLRFRGSNSATLSRTPSVSGNRKVWTWSAWVKRGSLDSSATDYVLFSSPSQSGNDGIAAIYFNANKLHTYYDTSGANPYGAIGPRQYVDTTSWMHIVWSVDAVNTRHSVWVNGVLVSTDPSRNPPNYEYAMNRSGYTHTMGTQAWGASNYFDGYMAEVNFVDGQSLTPSSFGDFDANNNWMPKRYTGTYGTNGFYLPFNYNSVSTNAGLFNGSNQYLATTNTQIIPATGDFTVEAMIYKTNTDATIYSQGTTGSAGRLEVTVIGTTLGIQIGAGSFNSTATINNNQWYYIAFTRTGSTGTFYVNGVAAGTGTLSAAVQTTPFWVGLDWTSTYFGGYISNLRVSNVVRTISTTSSTTAFTNDANTVLLTLQSATVVDNSTNAHSITNNNTVIMSRQYPFGTPIGNDSSGNSNTWTPNNISLIDGVTYDSVLDSPTNTIDSNGNIVGNYAIIDAANNSGLTISDAGSKWVGAGATPRMAYGTLPISSGKWYFEYTMTQSNSGGNWAAGFGQADVLTASGSSPFTSANAWSIMTGGNGTVLYKVNNNVFTNLSGLWSGTLPGAVIGVAVDYDAGKAWFSKDNVWVEGDPSAGTTPSYTGINSYGNLKPIVYGYNSSDIGYANYGQRPFTYTPPTGFKAINTKNLSDSGSYNLPDSFGNFVNTPDLVWIKSRTNGSYRHQWFDTIRGPRNALFSSDTTAQGTYESVQSFIPNGITLGTEAGTNEAGGSHVGWFWNRGKTPGFDIVSYGGDGVNGRMIKHNLGVTPAFYITKCLTGYNNSNSFTDWSVYHQSCPTYTGNSRQGKQALWLHSTLGAANGVGGFFNNATSTEFSPNQINYDNSSGQAYIAYLWAEVPGFSKFGGYTGNNSTNGPFVYLGFRPRFILLKKIGEASTTYGWQIYDTARSPANLDNLPGFWADTTAAEAPNTYAIDLLSNGFKIRTDNTNMNNSSTFVYAAFAESPFKYANAR